MKTNKLWGKDYCYFLSDFNSLKSKIMTKDTETTILANNNNL